MKIEKSNNPEAQAMLITLDEKESKSLKRILSHAKADYDQHFPLGLRTHQMRDDYLFMQFMVEQL